MPVIQIAENVKKAELGSSPLVTLRGSDADSDDNGKIEFSFQQEIDLFEIDKNGEIFMKREFTNRDENMIMIPITIRDLGNPCLFTKYNIFILRSNESFNATALTMMIQEKQHTKQFLLTAADSTIFMAILTGGVLVVVAIGLLCCYKCRQSKQDRRKRSLVLKQGSHLRDNRNEEADWMNEVQWHNVAETRQATAFPPATTDYESPDIDSGAGDSISDDVSSSFQGQPGSSSYSALSQGQPRSPMTPLNNSPVKYTHELQPKPYSKQLRAQPSFSTFKDEDTISVEIYDERLYSPGHNARDTGFTVNRILNN